VRLFAIDQIKGRATTPGYTEPLTVEFLEANPNLVLDTRHFSPEFKQQLLMAFDDLDNALDGLLVSSENFQALNLLLARYRQQIRCIYIDPPFNTESDQFLYKDAYRTSTWATMMVGRLGLGRELLTLDGTLYTHLDHNSNYIARYLLEDVMGADNFLNEVIWRIGWVSGYKTIADRYVRNHETILVYTKSHDYYFNKDAARIP
jgi:adenine-specific DNA-methyltransferase